MSDEAIQLDAPKVPADVFALCMKIQTGQFANDEIEAIAKAISVAIAESVVALRWMIRFDGLEAKAGEFTLNEARAIEQATKYSWRMVNPADSIGEFIAVARHLLVSRKGMTEAEADERLGKVTVDEWQAALDVYAADPTRTGGE